MSTTTTPSHYDLHQLDQIASYVATFPSDGDDGACDVTVEVGCDDDGRWWVVTSDDAGGDTDLHGPHTTRDDAVSAAEDLAAECDEGDGTEDAEEYLARIEAERIEADRDAEGDYGIGYAGVDGAADDSAPAERYSSLDGARRAENSWYAAVLTQSPTALTHLMAHPIVMSHDDDGWRRVESEAE